MEVGPGVVEGLHLEAQHGAIRHHRHLDVEEGALVAMAAGLVVLGAILGPLHRTLRLARQQGEHADVGVRVDLDPEATADVLGNEVELVDTDPHRRCDDERPEQRELVIGDDANHVRAGVPVHQHRVALDRRRRIAVEVELVDLHDVIGLLQRPIDVAVVVDPFPGDVVAKRLVEDVGVGIGGGNGIDVHRQRLVLHLDRVRGVDGELSGLCEHHNHGLALIANDVDPEEVLL